MQKKSCRLIYSVILILSFSVLSMAQNRENGSQKPDASKVEKKAKSKYLVNETTNEYRYTTNTEIREEDELTGNIIVVESNLVVRGVVNGDILVIYGDIAIKENASINGNITSVDGKISQEIGSTVTGNQVETRARNLVSNVYWDEERGDFDDEGWDWDFGHRFRGSYSTLPMQEIDEHAVVRYNRVQGLFIGLGIPKTIRGKYNFINFHGFLGYGFKEKKWRFEAGLDRWFFNQRDYRFEIGAKLYDLTDTKDDWLITDEENSLSAFFLNDDYHDFYRRNGYEIHASQNLSIFLKGTLAYRNDNYDSLEKHTNWSLFGNDDFKDNPPIKDGNMRSVYGELYLDTRNNKKLPRKGWYGKASMEVSNSKMNSEFSFNQYILELRRYQNFGRGERIDFRLKGGSAEGTLPIQKWYELGGFSTLRGFYFKQFYGDRMLLGNVEYNISPRTFSSTFLFMDELNYIIFFDFGSAWFANNYTTDDNWYNGFSHLKLRDIKSDLGMAVTFNDGEFRINFAKRLDTNKKPLAVSFRIVKPF